MLNGHGSTATFSGWETVRAACPLHAARMQSEAEPIPACTAPGVSSLPSRKLLSLQEWGRGLWSRRWELGAVPAEPGLGGGFQAGRAEDAGGGCPFSHCLNGTKHTHRSAAVAQAVWALQTDTHNTGIQKYRNIWLLGAALTLPMKGLPNHTQTALSRCLDADPQHPSHPNCPSSTGVYLGPQAELFATALTGRRSASLWFPFLSSPTPPKRCCPTSLQHSAPSPAPVPMADHCWSPSWSCAHTQLWQHCPWRTEKCSAPEK